MSVTVHDLTFINNIVKMNSKNYTNMVNNDKNECTQIVQERLRSMMQSRNYDWKMSYSFINANRKNIILQRKATHILCSYKKEQLSNVCPAYLKILKDALPQEKRPVDDDLQSKDVDFEEYEACLDKHASDLSTVPKFSTWDEYKKLLELSKSRIYKHYTKPYITEATFMPKIRIGKYTAYLRLRRHLSTRTKRSIIRQDSLNGILVVDSNYVQFRNFKLNKYYKKTITLQNVSTLPARFQIRGRPYRSKFQVMIKPVIENRGIVAPGMKMKLDITFRCDNIESPEELLIINVEHGSSLVIRMHGYKEPPLLLGYCIPEEKHYYSDTKLNRSFYSEMVTSISSKSTDSTTSSSVSDISCPSEDNTFVSMTFDCKKGFVGEEVFIPMRFKNVGGNGRFFIMSETDWFSMDILDITESNALRLACFVVQPAYFALKKNQEITFYMYFTPECYGIHSSTCLFIDDFQVEKLFILCDNCSLLATEIIGDGLMYEPSFIQFSKHIEKVLPYKRNIDKKAKYYVNLNTDAPGRIAQTIICINNTSEICMQFYWKKRNVEANTNLSERNYYPLEFLHIKPEKGVFVPTSAHYFTLTAEYRDLDPNYYFAVLQLYVEDIPVEALADNTKFQTHECRTRRRKCSKSVDVWVADIEVWLEHMIDDESERPRSDDTFKHLTETPSDFGYFETIEEEEFEYEEEEEEFRFSTSYQLIADELFSHLDFVNLRQFEPLFQEKIINVGIIRPSRSLFIGIEEIQILKLKNITNTSLRFSWGNIGGLDTSKVNLCVCPEHGEVPANDVKEVEITFTPIKEGIVRSFFIPCFIGDTRKMIMLGIECSIEPLYVTFYFPTADDDFQLNNNFVRVEWRVDSFKLALDMAGKSRKYLNVLDKYKSREERELMNTNLDQGTVLRDTSAGPSMQEMDEAESAEQSSTSIRTSEVIQMSNLTTNDNHTVSPIYDTFLPAPTQSVVIEFLNLPLNTVKKKTFIIKNETSIPSDFSLHVKNNYPITCSCEWKNQKDRIKNIYKRIFGRDKKLIEEALFKMKQPGSGLVIYVDPLHSDLSQFKAIPVDIYVYSDTWGIYVDEIEISITGLPQYTIGICVQVVGSPISLSISDRNEFNIPVIKYGTVSVGFRLQDRQIQLKNTSVIPIVIDWHTFIIKPVIQKMPFNVAFDICTPFTDKLSMKLRTQSKTDSEVHLEKHKKPPLKKNLHEYNSAISSCTDFTTSTQMDSSLVALSAWSFSDNESDGCSEHLESTVISSLMHEQETFVMSDATTVGQKKQIELSISLLPFYGLIDTKMCTVAPKEMFILPKSTASLEVNVHLEKYRFMTDVRDHIEGELLCKLLGFVRIAPRDMYKDNNYARQAGNYLSPIEIDVTANIVPPKLDFCLSTEDITFTCCATDVMQSRKKMWRMNKTFFFYNTTDQMIDISLETNDPFYVESVFVHAGINCCKSGSICINGHGSAEVEILCEVNARLIHNIMLTSSRQDLQNSKITVTETLHIIHSDKKHQNVELVLQVILPVLKLSSYTLDFGLVYIGDVKKLALIIENRSASRVNIKITKKCKNKAFMIDQKKIMLSGVQDMFYTITVAFQPKKPGQSVETLEITTDVPYNTEECQLYGEGTLDEKYHTPGV